MIRGTFCSFPKFPSPSGVSHFSIAMQSELGSFADDVSVPFRGISFLNKDVFIEPADMTREFPSPSGVSHFSMKVKEAGKKVTDTFPSPSGVSHFSMFNITFIPWVKKCFRPLPGYLISQYNRRYRTHGVRYQVSVPFRGISFLNKENEIKESRKKAVSVPFRGISFLNAMDEIEKTIQNVSVPFRGISFLNCSRVSLKNYIRFVSVPFRGISFLNMVSAD